MCQEAQKESRESKIFYNEISVSYEYGLNGLNESRFGQPLLGRSVKLLTTFLGIFFPLCGRRVHTRSQNTEGKTSDKRQVTSDKTNKNQGNESSLHDHRTTETQGLPSVVSGRLSAFRASEDWSAPNKKQIKGSSALRGLALYALTLD